MLPAIPYLRLRTTLSAEEPAVLPPFLGSTLRGAFGHALRRMVCVMGPEQACVDCGLRQACSYTRIFEPYVDGEPPPFLRGIDQAVRPYVFEPLDEGGRLMPGGTLSFDLLLFGQAAELAAYSILAVERMARVGLGVRRVAFRLQKVEALSPDGSAQEVFRAGAPLSGARLSTALPPAAPLPEGEVTLRLETPLRIKVRDHLNDRPRFRDLAFNMLPRILELAHFHAPGAMGAEGGADGRRRRRRQRSLRDLLDVLPQVLEPARPHDRAVDAVLPGGEAQRELGPVVRAGIEAEGAPALPVERDVGGGRALGETPGGVGGGALGDHPQAALPRRRQCPFDRPLVDQVDRRLDAAEGPG